MTLKIIGAGFGRTGTTSMKEALEILGFSKCHHMKEVMLSRKQVDLFDQISRGMEVDWDKVFEGFEASIDWPSAAYYKQLMIHYPDAKVILTERNPDCWYRSTRDTIFTVSNNVPGILMFLLPRVRTCIEMIQRLVWQQVFDGRFKDREHAIAVYNKNVAEVKSHVPAERLLVHSSKQGWETLCGFLDLPIPSQPYPHSNEGKVIKRVVMVFAFISYLPWVLLIVAVAGLVWRLF